MISAMGRALKRQEIILAIAVILCAGWFAYLSYARWFVMESVAGDLGSIDSAAYNTAHGAFMLSTGLKVQNMWADHFTPILLVLSFYYLFSDGFLFIFLWQSLSVALASIPIYLIAKETLGHRAALPIALAYLANGHLHSALLFDYHEAAHLGFFALMAVFTAMKKRWGWFAFFGAMLLACREDAALILICIGLWLALFRREWRRGAVTAILAAVYFVILMKAVFPYLKTFSVEAHYESAYMYFENYAWLGKTPSQAVMNIITSPAEMAGKIFAPARTGEWAKLTAQYAGLPFLSPGGLLIMAPTTLSLFLNDYRARYLFFWHYPMLAIPFWALAFIWGLANLQAILRAGRIGNWPIERFRPIFLPISAMAGLAVSAYALMTAVYLIHGPFDSTWAGIRFRLDDLEKPLLILFAGALILLLTYPPNRFMGRDLAERTAMVMGIYLLTVSLWLAADKGGLPVISRKDYQKYFDEERREHSKKAMAILDSLPWHFNGVVGQGIYTLGLHNPNAFLFRGFDKYPFGARKVDYIVLDVNAPVEEPIPQSHIRRLAFQMLLREKGYAVIRHEDGIYIFQRGADIKGNYQAFMDSGGKFPPEIMYKSSGEDAAVKGGAGKYVTQAVAGKHQRGFLAYGPYVKLYRGEYTAHFLLKAGPSKEGPIAILDVAGGMGGKILASRQIAGDDFGKEGEWAELSLPFKIEDAFIDDMEFRVEYLGAGDLAFGQCRISMRLDNFLESAEAARETDGPVVPPFPR